MFRKNKNHTLKPQNLMILKLVLYNILLRVFHHLVYVPYTSSDLESYLELSYAINGDFNSYQALRTPVYPLVLFLYYIDERAVWIVQSLMGIVVSVLIYSIAKYLTKDNWAFFIALAYSLSFNILFAEAALLSETTSIFFLIFAFYAFTSFIKENKSNNLFYIGLFTSLAILTRPIMIVLIPALLITLYIMYKKQNNNKLDLLKKSLVFIIPVFVLLLSVSLFNKYQSNYFGISSYGGLGLCNISGAFVEKCQNPEYQQIRDILIEYREKRGTHNWVAHHALEDLMKKTGLSFTELSKKLTSMSFELFLQNPDLYLKSIIPSYINFWAAGNLWITQEIQPTFVRNIFEYFWIPQKIILITINIIFIISILVLFIKKKSIIIINNPILLFMVVTIISASLFQALVESLENVRYKLPFQPLILIFVSKMFFDTIKNAIENKISFNRSYSKLMKEL